MKFIFFKEPELEFANGGTHVDVRFGIARFGPLDLGDTKAALGADGEIWVKLAVGVHLASSLSVPKGHAPSGKAIFPVKTGVP